MKQKSEFGRLTVHGVFDARRFAEAVLRERAAQDGMELVPGTVRVELPREKGRAG